MRSKISRREERGLELLEFAIGATVFFIGLFAILEGCRLLWTHNALADAARRGARYAVTHYNNSTCRDYVKNVVVFGDPAGGTQPVVNGLTTGVVDVTYTGFGVKQGTAT